MIKPNYQRLASIVMKAIIDKLNRSLNDIFAKPEFRKRWEDLGTPVIGGSPEKFGALIRSETVRLGKIVKQSGAVID